MNRLCILQMVQYEGNGGASYVCYFDALLAFGLMSYGLYAPNVSVSTFSESEKSSHNFCLYCVTVSWMGAEGAPKYY